MTFTTGQPYDEFAACDGQLYAYWSDKVTPADFCAEGSDGAQVVGFTPVFHRPALPTPALGSSSAVGGEAALTPATSSGAATLVVPAADRCSVTVQEYVETTTVYFAAGATVDGGGGDRKSGVGGGGGEGGSMSAAEGRSGNVFDGSTYGCVPVTTTVLG